MKKPWHRLTGALTGLTVLLAAGCAPTPSTPTAPAPDSGAAATVSQSAAAPTETATQTTTRAVTAATTTTTAATTTTTAATTTTVAAATAPTAAPRPDPAAYAASLPLTQRIGQLFMASPESLTGSKEPQTDPAATVQALCRRPIGGVILFSRNIASPTQLTAFNRAVRDALPISPFIGVDEEGGRVSRLANHPAFSLPTYESAFAVGSTGDTRQALAMGQTIGGYLREYGFSVDFAPVADVNTNPANPIIGTRAFSDRPEPAAKMAKAMARGLAAEGIIPVYKHFPGHGDTREDSHRELAVTEKTAAQLAACEWVPFREAIEQDWVMVGHIGMPAVTGSREPASLCPAAVTGILREQLGFTGVIVTDSLSMKAVTSAYSPGDAAVAALQAGCDILLMPADLDAAFAAVEEAVESGQWPESALNAAVTRILRCKAAHGLWTPD